MGIYDFVIQCGNYFINKCQISHYYYLCIAAILLSDMRKMLYIVHVKYGRSCNTKKHAQEIYIR